MVFDGRLWHGTIANTGNTDRLGVLTTFCSPQFRQQENQTLGLDRDLWDSCSEKLKSRLGFKVWNAYGRIESSMDYLIDIEPERIKELKPSNKNNERCRFKNFGVSTLNRGSRRSLKHILINMAWL